MSVPSRPAVYGDELYWDKRIIIERDYKLQETILFESDLPIQLSGRVKDIQRLPSRDIGSLSTERLVYNLSRDFTIIAICRFHFGNMKSL